ncbi:MAG: Clp protease N-terminal domain-containing protein [Acidimicrobiales bacterium]
MATDAPTPRQLTTVRLDDLIEAIVKVNDDVLDQLRDAMLAAQHLDDVADHLIGHFVDQARRSGASWTEIGQSMGVTKQAARKRFLPKDPGTAPTSGDTDDGSSRFTTRARNTIVAAHDAARATASATIAPAHLLLGLLSEPQAFAWRSLEAQGCDLDAVRAAALAAVPEPAGRRRARAHPLRPRGPQGARARLSGGVAPRAQLHRHGAHAARAARARGGHPGAAHGARRHEGAGRGVAARGAASVAPST